MVLDTPNDTLQPYNDMDESNFKEAWRRTAKDVHKTAVEKGWWDKDRGPAEAICLMHSELSEALEVARKDGAASKIAEELADCVIRIMDYCEHEGLPIAEELIRKAEYNKTRPYKHGKVF